MARTINQVTFRERTEFNSFIKNYIDDNGNLDIFRFTNIPPCINALYIRDKKENLQAAAYFLMEELEVELESLTDSDIFKYIKEHSFQLNYNEDIFRLIADCSRDNRSVMNTMENNNFSYASFYEYGKNAFKSFVEYRGLNKREWLINNYNVSSPAFNTVIDKENMRIKWDMLGIGCRDLIRHSGIELYYGMVTSNSSGPAYEMWNEGSCSDYFFNMEIDPTNENYMKIARQMIGQYGRGNTVGKFEKIDDFSVYTDTLQLFLGGKDFYDVKRKKESGGSTKIKELPLMPESISCPKKKNFFKDLMQDISKKIRLSV